MRTSRKPPAKTQQPVEAGLMAFVEKKGCTGIISE
jgi:hypothetical protein